MLDLFELMQNHIGFFLLVFTRISGIFTTAPVFGSRNIPTYAKAGLSLTIAALIFPLLYNDGTRVPTQLVHYMLIAFGELLIGLILGFVSSLLFSGVQMAGQLLDMQIGFGIVNVFDPQLGQQVPLLGNFKYILALVIFLSINGHHVLLSSLVASFNIIPVTGITFKPVLAHMIVDMVAGIFIMAVKICLPVLAALFLTDIALGILARTMPQMNIFVVGVPIKIAIGMFVLSLIIPFYLVFLEVGFNAMYKDIYRILATFS